MGVRPQPMLFSWAEVEESPELERLERVLRVIPDRELIGALERERDGRRRAPGRRPEQAPEWTSKARDHPLVPARVS